MHSIFYHFCSNNNICFSYKHLSNSFGNIVSDYITFLSMNLLCFILLLCYLLLSLHAYNNVKFLYATVHSLELIF